MTSGVRRLIFFGLAGADVDCADMMDRSRTLDSTEGLLILKQRALWRREYRIGNQVGRWRIRVRVIPRARCVFADRLIFGLRLSDIYRRSFVDERKKFRRGGWMKPQTSVRMRDRPYSSLMKTVRRFEFYPVCHRVADVVVT